MAKKFCLTLAVVCTAFFSSVSAQQTAKVTASGIGYLEYLPPGYHSRPDKFPLVISLHGIGEKGTASTDRKKVLADLQKVDNAGLPRYVRNGTKYPFILISPQLKSNHGTWPPAYVIQVLNHVRKYLRIDDRRIYLTGLSLGGFGVWRTAAEYPELFAAIAPICSGGNALSQADNLAAKNLPVWGFHGDHDRIVSYTVTTRMINAMNTAPKKPNPLAKATIFPGMGHVIWDRAYQQTNLLDWMLRHKKGSAPSTGDPGEEDEDEDKPSNKPPVARAGSDRTLMLPASALYVQGTASDPDGKITSFKWTKISGGNASLSGTTSSKLRAYNLKEGSYIFRLTVKDDDGVSRSDDMKVLVKKSAGEEKPEEDKEDESGSKNSPPLVTAGPDIVFKLPKNSITIQGRATDKDGKIVSYEWTKTYGRRASLSGSHTSKLNIHNMERGVYIFRLRVKDDDGSVTDDYFKITVHAADHKMNDSSNKAPSNKPNRAPHAYAGPDRILTLPGNSISIKANASDQDGKIVSYHWTKTYGRRASLSGAQSSGVRISNLERGIYIFRLTVEDDDGATQEDYFKITVKES